MNKADSILYYYLKAKEAVLNNGYYYEVAWQESQNVKSITVRNFLSEYAWVVLSSGMKEVVVRKKFYQLSIVLNDWHPNLDSKSISCLRRKALKIYNHLGKINAILGMIGFLERSEFSDIIDNIATGGVEYLRRFPYMGPATSFHFAKNLGFDVVKPDRHLLRISQSFGYECPDCFCSEISKVTGERKSVIDLVLWRYAATTKNYLKAIS